MVDQLTLMLNLGQKFIYHLLTFSMILENSGI